MTVSAVLDAAGARRALQRLLLARARGELDHLGAAVREDGRQDYADFAQLEDAWVGAPPNARSARSSAITTDGIVRSHSGTTTRKRLHANHAQNNIVARPATLGASP
jgi:hypothetical protein